jgi:peptidoglycan hydrolase-like protein with peptidoglycan-binding domain
MGRTRAAAALWVAAALVSGCAGAVANEPRDGTTAAAVATTSVTRRDLTIRDELDGSLGYVGAVPLVAGRDGILTRMPSAGAVVRRGDVVAEIDGVATRLLLGDRPAWRRLAVGCPSGPDIGQLNDNLAALGYAERDELPSELFDWRTRQAVYRWQDDLGLRQTGAVELGDVMFLPYGIRIGTAEAQRGTRVSAGQILANATRRKRVVTVDLDAARRGSLSEDSPVVVVLPDRTRVDATVRSIGRVVSAPAVPDDTPNVKVEIELVEGAAGELEAAPVIVIIERVLAEDALTVPVGALMALAEGGYAVERVAAGGTEQVAVEPGQFADGLVEISGDIAEGDQVVVPS